jgi:pilus assembly protein CpaC
MVYADMADSGNVSVSPELITFLLGESTIVRAPWPVARVNVTDATITNVEVVTADQVLLQGLKVGSTDLIVWNEDETKVQRWKVQVRLDTASLKAKLDMLFPDATLQVDQSGDAFILTGLVRSADQVTQLHALLEASGVKYVDMTSLAGVQQVQLEVRVAEVSREALRALGISYFHTDDDWFGGMRGVSTTGATNTSIDIGVPSGTVAGDVTPFVFNNDVAAGPATTIFAGFPRADFEFFLEALIENKAMRLLANPTLVALSGEQASFLVGGEYPIPVVQGSGAGAGGGNTVTIQYKEYGVRLSFEPTVLGDGTIRLHTMPEVSSLTNSGAVTIGGFSVPALLTRRTETTLELKNGQTFAMAGLLQHENQATNARIPGLGDLPILGPLFRSVRYQKRETELVVLVSASLVEPMSLASVPPLPGFAHSEPNDWELYIEGRIEGKEPAKINADHARYLKQMGLDRLVGPGAWDSYGAPQSSSRGEFSPNQEIKQDSKAPTSQRESNREDEADKTQEP